MKGTSGPDGSREVWMPQRTQSTPAKPQEFNERTAQIKMYFVNTHHPQIKTIGLNPRAHVQKDVEDTKTYLNYEGRPSHGHTATYNAACPFCLPFGNRAQSLMPEML
ncbi:hypothetical protein VTO42DRAFT_5709 [Malbranchea cinnamomea]